MKAQVKKTSRLRTGLNSSRSPTSWSAHIALLDQIVKVGVDPDLILDVKSTLPGVIPPVTSLPGSVQSGVPTVQSELHSWSRDFSVHTVCLVASMPICGKFINVPFSRVKHEPHKKASLILSVQ